MRLLIHQLLLPLEYDEVMLFKAASKKINCSTDQLENIKIIKRSIDARPRHSAPMFSLSVLVTFKLPRLPKEFPENELVIVEEHFEKKISYPVIKTNIKSPVIIGAGPAGLMAALVLAQSGLNPVIIERGAAVESRKNDVEQFWIKGILNPESNVLYGEGGAGLFSDGKLTARSKDKPSIRFFLETLVECGAPESILIDYEPHVGSDKLFHIVPILRSRIKAFGGSFRFNTKLSGLKIENNQITGVIVNSSELIETNTCILATGHSARDVYKMLFENNVPLEAKPFAVGVRLELPQYQVNKAQWGKFASHPQLSAASFRLTRRSEEETRPCYSFCMCPGGTVISCASSTGEMTTNGMSLSNRAGNYANAAFLVPISTEDYLLNNGQPDDVLSGYVFQKKIEQRVFTAGGHSYHLPASTLQDYLDGRTPKSLPEYRSWHYAVPADLHSIFPDYVNNTLVNSIPKMLCELNGANLQDVLLYGAETRSSSPVRIVRDSETGQSTGISGLFPAGEGAGYAGGIVSSALDGIKAAENIIQNL